MKQFLLFLVIFGFLVSCKKDNDGSEPDLFNQNYAGQILISYDSSYTVENPFGNSYIALIPEENTVNALIDVDGDQLDDFKLTISHYLYNPSPHAFNTLVTMSIEGTDTSCKVAVNKNSQAQGIAKYAYSAEVNADSAFQQMGNILVESPLGNSLYNYGSLIIGVKKRIGDKDRFGYVMIESEWARIRLIRSGFNKNQDHCTIEGFIL